MTAENTVRHKRRNIFSYPTAQSRIVLFFICIALVYVALCCYVAMEALDSLGSEFLTLDLSGPVLHDAVVVLQRHHTMLILQLSIYTLLSIVMLGLAAVLLSHRIGGPLYQLRKYCDEMAAGRTPPRRIRFRSGDFFAEVAESFNRFQEARGIIPPGAPPSPTEKKE